MSDQHVNWHLLRTKIGTADDVDWQGTQVSPQSLTALVAGTATAGVYSITLSGEFNLPNGSRIQIDQTLSATRVAQTSAQMAAELQVLGAANEVFLRYGILVTVSTATLTFQVPPSFRGVLTRTVTAPATITFPLGDTFIPMPAAPIAAGASKDCGKVVVSVHAMNGTAFLNPGTAFTFTLVPVEVASYKDPSGVLQRRVQVGEAIADCLLDTEYTVPLRGARAWSVRLLTNADVADVPVGTDRFRVIWRDAGVE